MGGNRKISVQGPYVTTHKRHFSQKAWYTIATEWDSMDERHYICSHEEIFNRNDRNQDLLYKILLPAKEKPSALLQLEDFNINSFTLFQTEDSLIQTLATREFDVLTPET